MVKRTSVSASVIFRRKFKGRKNFMTPDREKMGKINKNVAFEIASGRGFSGGKMYGVTVVSVNPKTGRTMSQDKLSDAFESRAKADAHINKLKRRLMLKKKTKRRSKK